MLNSDETESVPPLQSYLELLRLPNVFTAVADVAMGFFFLQAPWAFSDDGQQSLLPIGLWTVGLLAAASALLYSAGMVLNDVFDIELDRQEQPDRPLPSGRIPLNSARWLGWQLLTLGVMSAGGTAVMLAKFPPAPTDNFVLSWLPAIVATALAALIVLYNAGLKRTPLGPLAMGGCRMLNVLLGMSALRVPWRIEHWAVAAGIGIYIAGVTWFARNDARRSDRWQLIAATLIVLAGVGLVGSLPWLTNGLWIVRQWHKLWWNWCGIIALLAGFVLIRGVPAIVEPSPGPVRAAVRRSIAALIFLDAAACYAAAGPFYAVLVALLVVPTTVVGRWVDPG
ncbi:MAG: UbiA family prenyltransferase [Thermoguttaceae bacterium]